MGRFFVPALHGDDPAAERTYRALRDLAETRTGVISRERRIEGVLCRRSGHDCQLKVGEHDTADGRMVTAIIQLGRDTYTVHHLSADSAQQPEPFVLHKSDVYAVTDFQ